MVAVGMGVSVATGVATGVLAEEVPEGVGERVGILVELPGGLIVGNFVKGVTVLAMIGVIVTAASTVIFLHAGAPQVMPDYYPHP